VEKKLDIFSRVENYDDIAYLATAKKKQVLFAAGRENDQGIFLSYKIDAATGKLSRLNKVQYKFDAAYMITDNTESVLFCAGYGGGSVYMFPLEADGKLGGCSQEFILEGSSINPDRQAEPHPHSVAISPNNKWIVVPDLGSDLLRFFWFNAREQSLTPWINIPAPPGCGPRHSAISPDGNYLYVMTEMHSTVLVYKVDEAAGTVTLLQNNNALPNGYCGQSHGADIRLSPDARLLYASNRGHTSIAVFSIHPDSRLLTFRSLTKTRSQVRNMRFCGEGKLLFCGGESGKLPPAFEILETDPVNAELNLMPFYAPSNKGAGLEVFPLTE
jgi:6-phosphogluconolactonase